MDREWESLFQRMEKWAKEMEQFMHHLLSARSTPLPFSPEAWRPAVNVFETERTVVVLAELAGVGPNDISVRYEPGRLIVVGHRPDPVPEGCFAVHRMEIATGPFAFEVPLPGGVTPEGAKATCHDGWLEVHLPKTTGETPGTIILRLQPAETETPSPPEG